MEPLWFTKGAEVEVRSDDEGFIGAWYAAVVLRSAAALKGKKRLFVQYHNLVEDERGLRPLREYVDASHVRPRPPGESPRLFELNEEVDAFYNDGWWRGVIIKVLDNSKYAVLFENPAEELEFGQSELRAHLEWINGEWVRPEIQGTIDLGFTTRTLVEVCLDEENCWGVWFPATVLKKVGKDSFLVEYQSLRLGDQLGLKEIVDSLHIRPSPPHSLEDKSFVLSEKVDAFFHFGWWSGIITKILVGTRYNVYFKHLNEEKEFSHSELRHHVDWIEGKWVQASQDISIISHNSGGINLINQEQIWQAGSISQSAEMCNQLTRAGASMDLTKGKLPSSAISSSKKINQSTPNKEKSPYHVVTSSKNKMMQSTPKCDSEMPQPCKKSRKGETTEAPLSLKACCVQTTSTGTSSEAKTQYGLATPTVEGEGTNHLKFPMIHEQPSAKTGSLVRKKRSKRPTKPQIPFIRALEWYNVANTAPPNSGQERHVEINITDPLTKEKSSSCLSPDNHRIINLSNFIELENQIVGSGKPQVDWQRNLFAKQSQQGPQKKRYPSCGIEFQQQKVDGERKEIEGVRKTRGRPLKAHVGGTKALVKGKKPKSSGEVCEEVVQNEHVTNDIEMSITEESEVLGMRDSQAQGPSFSKKEHLKLIRDEKEVPIDPVRRKEIIPSEKKGRPSQDLIAQGMDTSTEQPSTKRRRPKAMGLDVKTPTQDQCQAFGGEMVDDVVGMKLISKEDEMRINGMPSGIHDEDQPLWIEEFYSSTNAMDNQSISQPKAAITWTLDQYDEPTGEEQDGIVLQCYTNAHICEDVSVEKQSLPFVKRSPMWEMIESMEVFRMLPQKPHFRPLYECNEECREGLAIGNMVTFASLVEKTCKSRLDTPRSIFKKRLDTLIYLKTLGFNVKPIKARLKELLTIKDRQEWLEDESKAVECEITKWKRDNDGIDAEINDIGEKIRELEQSISILNKKQASVTVQKEINSFEVATLQMKVDKIKKNILNGKVDFDVVTLAPW